MKHSINHFTYNSAPGLSFEGCKKITVPDQALSLRTLLAQHTRGVPMEERQAVYFEDEEIPDFSQMDLVDIHEYHQKTRERIQGLQNQIKESERIAKEKRDALHVQAQKAQNQPEKPNVKVSSQPTEDQ